MAALINAASRGKLVATEPPRIQAIIPSEASDPPETPEKVRGAHTYSFLQCNRTKVIFLVDASLLQMTFLPSGVES